MLKVHVAPFLYLAAHAAGESTYAGDRDVRYLNCAVPCEFECTRGPLFSAWRAQPGVRSVWKVGVRGQVDLGPHGKAAYSQALHRALEDVSQRVTPSAKPAAVHEPGRVPAIKTEELPLSLRLMQWDCEENCRYECMILNRDYREREGEQAVHYVGKWPFTRVFGVQELFSSLFSFLNGLPYMLFLAFPPSAEERQGARSSRLWMFYAMSQVNTWIQSTLFHARETKLTEALDYHGATLGLCMSLATVATLNWPEGWSIRKAVGISFLPVTVFWCTHVLYLSFVDFNYGYNMQVAVGVGVAATLAWILWAARHFRSRPFAWKVVVASLGPYLVLPLELLDFPPIGGLMDAHALWHMGTVPIAFLFCSFIRDYIRHESSGAEMKGA